MHLHLRRGLHITVEHYSIGVNERHLVDGDVVEAGTGGGDEEIIPVAASNIAGGAFHEASFGKLVSNVHYLLAELCKLLRFHTFRVACYGQTVNGISLNCGRYAAQLPKIMETLRAIYLPSRLAGGK